MKKSIPFLVLTFFMLITIGSCKKKDKEASGTCSFTINGKEWKGDKMADITHSETKFSFSFGKGLHNANKDVSITNGFEKYDEILNINLVDKKFGRQSIPISTFPVPENLDQNSSPFVLFGTFVDLGCSGCEMFYVGNSDVENNWIEVTKQEDNFKKIPVESFPGIIALCKS